LAARGEEPLTGNKFTVAVENDRVEQTQVANARRESFDVTEILAGPVIHSDLSDSPMDAFDPTILFTIILTAHNRSSLTTRTAFEQPVPRTRPESRPTRQKAGVSIVSADSL
jgi:hypothetical protein